MIIKKDKQDTKLPEIAKEAVRLFVRQGIAATTIRDIAQAAKVAEGTLYRHYASKEELARDLLVKNLASFTDHLDQIVFAEAKLSRQLLALTQSFAQAYQNNEDLARFILFQHASEMSGIPKRMRTPRHVIRQMLARSKEIGEIAKDCDIDILASLMLGSLSQWLLAKSYGDIKGNLFESVPEVSSILCRMAGVKP
jgi:AcrR family transcriptional regulator